VKVCGHTLYAPDLTPGQVVLDLGAHRGMFSNELATRYGCRCHAIEASPDLYREIPAMDRVTKYNYAVSSHTGSRDLTIAQNAEASSIIGVVDSETRGTVRVSAIDLQTFVSEHDIDRIDILKVDIEGAEVEVLDAAPDQLLQSVRQITIEFHDFNGVVSLHDVRRVRQRLKRLGFACFRLPPWRYVDTLFVNRDWIRPRLVDRVQWLALPFRRRLQRALAGEGSHA
jgi:FkbM family methyltransferase